MLDPHQVTLTAELPRGPLRVVAVVERAIHIPVIPVPIENLVSVAMIVTVAEPLRGRIGGVGGGSDAGQSHGRQRRRLDLWVLVRFPSARRTAAATGIAPANGVSFGSHDDDLFWHYGLRM
jgi:hypothetical protein